MPPSRDGVGRGSLPAPRTHPSSAARPEHGCLRPWLVTALPRHAGHGWQRGSSPGTGVPAPAPQQHPACPTLGPGCFTPWPGCSRHAQAAPTSGPGCLTSRPLCSRRAQSPPAPARLSPAPARPRGPRPPSDGNRRHGGASAGARPGPAGAPPAPTAPSRSCVPRPRLPKSPLSPLAPQRSAVGQPWPTSRPLPQEGVAGRPAWHLPVGVTRTPGAPGHPKATHGAQHCTLWLRVAPPRGAAR